MKERQRQRAEIEHRVAMHASGPPLAGLAFGEAAAEGRIVEQIQDIAITMISSGASENTV